MLMLASMSNAAAVNDDRRTAIVTQDEHNAAPMGRCDVPGDEAADCRGGGQGEAEGPSSASGPTPETAVTAARTPPQRHWHSYGTDPLPTPQEALAEPFRSATPAGMVYGWKYCWGLSTSPRLRHPCAYARSQRR